jgi:hypothetical protein
VMGQDTRRVLAGMLALTPDEIGDLAARGIIQEACS